VWPLIPLQVSCLLLAATQLAFAAPYFTLCHLLLFLAGAAVPLQVVFFLPYGKLPDAASRRQLPGVSKRWSTL
jgi:hypothetical protein